LIDIRKRMAGSYRVQIPAAAHPIIDDVPGTESHLRRRRERLFRNLRFPVPETLLSAEEVLRWL